MQLNTKTTVLLQLFKAKVLNNVTLVNTFLCVVSLALFCFCLISVFNLKTEYSLKQFYPANHPLLLQEQKLRALFQSEKNLSLLVVLKSAQSASWLADSNYNLLKQIHTAFAWRVGKSRNDFTYRADAGQHLSNHFKKRTTNCFEPPAIEDFA